jgi:hypothetical protein
MIPEHRVQMRRVLLRDHGKPACPQDQTRGLITNGTRLGPVGGETGLDTAANHIHPDGMQAAGATAGVDGA